MRKSSEFVSRRRQFESGSRLKKQAWGRSTEAVTSGAVTRRSSSPWRCYVAVALICLPADQLLTVVGERVAADNAQIAGFQLEHQLGKDASFEVAAMHATC